MPDTAPLRFYRRIAVLGLEMLTSGGKLYFEINRAFGKDTVAMLCETRYREVRLQKDISHPARPAPAAPPPAAEHPAAPADA